MITSSTQPGASVSLIEAGLTAIVVVIACFWPWTGHKALAFIERRFGDIARRPWRAIVACGLAALMLRLAILPILPVPLPFIHDDFSFLFAADTFAAGRLTNPTPAMWAHFETFHITMQPTYMSMYFPAQGLVLAAGKEFIGCPWAGLLIAGALMCSVICWTLQAWLPPSWALLGGMLAVLRLALFSYWMNTYSGAGFVAAIGGALVIGALPRLLGKRRPGYAVVLTAGIIILAFSRPFEGMLLCLPVAVVVIKRLFFVSRRLAWKEVIRCAVVPLMLIVLAGLWLAYYDHRAFGNAFTLPYTVDRATYSVVPYYVWQPRREEPAYRHAVMRDFYTRGETRAMQGLQSAGGYLGQSAPKLWEGVRFFAGFALLVPLLMLPRVIVDRRLRFLIACALVLALGMAIEIFFLPHYAAPFTVVFYAIGLQCMRHLRVWRPRGRPVGRALVRGCVVLCVVLAAIRASAGPLHVFIGHWPSMDWATMWYSADQYGSERAAVEDRLKQVSGKQLVIVRYSAGHNPLDEWVYNSPDIDKAQIIWARDMDPASNAELICFYHDRRVWLLQPDVIADKLQPYPTRGEIEMSPGELADLQASGIAK